MRTNTVRYAAVALVALAAVTVVSTVAACAPPPGRPPAPLADPVPGYVRLGLDPMVAYTVTMDPALPAPVADAVRSAAQAAQAASGIELRLRSAVPDVVPGYGEITVAMGVSCQVEHEAGCATLWGFGDQRVLTGARVTIAPSMVAHRQLWSTVAHELGHALGLDHVDTRGFRPQVMGSAGAVLDAYQTGDLAGLAHAGRDARARATAPASVALADVVSGPQVLHWHE